MTDDLSGPRRVPTLLPARTARAWVIVDAESPSLRRYLDVEWPTAAAAERERLVLLRGFGMGHEWRVRLRIAPVW